MKRLSLPCRLALPAILLVAAPALAQRFAQRGAQAMPGTPEDLGRLVIVETGRWRQVVRAADIRVD